jgi:3-hydroxymyristoyl/3-hydroxydecanoyl-(acyl carrier protein) dehydratase
VSDRPREPEIREVRRLDDGVELLMYVPRDLAYLDGHFPDYPVVAGVVLLDWAIHFAGEHVVPGLTVGRAFQVKFRQVLRPDTSLSLFLRRPGAGARLTFEYRNDADVFSSGSIALGPS